MAVSSVHVVLEALPDLLDSVEIALITADGIGGGRAIDLRFDDLRDAARPARQEHNAIRYVDSLFDAVRDEDKGLALLLHQLQQVFLELAAVLLIDRRERLV